LHLNAVRIALAVIGRTHQNDFRLRIILAHMSYRLDHFAPRWAVRKGLSKTATDTPVSRKFRMPEAAGR
jgi:hypothetical protein